MSDLDVRLGRQEAMQIERNRKSTSPGLSYGTQRSRLEDQKRNKRAAKIEAKRNKRLAS